MVSASVVSSWSDGDDASSSVGVGWRVLPAKPVPFHPGPMRLAAAAALAGFDQARLLPTVTAVNGVEWDTNNELLTAVAICSAECGGDVFVTSYRPNANGSVDCGAWQINDVAHPEWFAHSSPLDVYGLSWPIYTDNAKMAWQVYAAAGYVFSPWRSYTVGANPAGYRGYLDWHGPGLTRMAWAQEGIDAMNAQLALGRPLSSVAMTYLEASSQPVSGHLSAVQGQL
jgi:lysozyme-like protein